MPEPDLIQLFVEPLNQLGIHYLITLDDWIARRGLGGEWQKASS